MRKHFFATIFLALAMGGGIAHAQTSAYANSLVINRTDGVNEYLQLTTDFNVDAEPGLIRLIHPEITIEYAMDEVENFKFVKHTFGQDQVYEGTHAANDAIVETNAPQRELQYVDGMLSASETIVAYDLGGREVARGTKIPTSQLPAGIYILKIGSTSLKIKL